VTHVLRGTQDAYGVFGLVLGPIAWIYLLALVTVLAAEINVVADRRPWPRALLTSFTDRVRLTPAHERAYTGYADSERHKGFQVVDVGFEPPQEATGRTAESPGSDVQAWGASRPLRVRERRRRGCPTTSDPFGAADQFTLAEELGYVSAASLAMGVDHSTYYRLNRNWLHQLRRLGVRWSARAARGLHGPRLRLHPPALPPRL
jgi:hypothetical protein